MLSVVDRTMPRGKRRNNRHIDTRFVCSWQKLRVLTFERVAKSDMMGDFSVESDGVGRGTADTKKYTKKKGEGGGEIFFVLLETIEWRKRYSPRAKLE